MVDVININYFHRQLAPSVQVMTDEHLREWEGRGGEGRGGEGRGGEGRGGEGRGGGKGETRMKGEDDKRSNTGQTRRAEMKQKEGGRKEQ